MKKPKWTGKGNTKKGVLYTVLMGVVLFFLNGCTGIDKRGDSPPSQPLYTIMGSGGKTTGPLRLTRIELNFQNDRGEITVPINGKVLPYAIIRFDGNGLFRATWIVDDRPLEEVSINITFGNTIILRTSPGTVFPTFEPGQHTLTLRITQPVPPFDVPVIRYFVTGERTGK